MFYIISILQDDDEMRLDRAIRRQFPSFKQGQLEKLLRQGKIRLDAQKAKAGTREEDGAPTTMVSFPPPLLELNL